MAKIKRALIHVIFAFSVMVSSCFLTHPETFWKVRDVVPTKDPIYRVHVGRFGAHPDDDIDDDEGFRAAIQDIRRHPGGWIICKRGQYDLRAPLSFAGVKNIHVDFFYGAMRLHFKSAEEKRRMTGRGNEAWIDPSTVDTVEEKS